MANLEVLDWAVISLVGVAVALYVRRKLREPRAKEPNTNTRGVNGTNGTSSNASTAAPKQTFLNERNIVERMKKSDKNCVIFFGSQTGTAEEYAGRLMKDARRFSFRAMTADLKDYDGEFLAQLSTIENSLVVFCLATYGEGEPTDNARDFYEWLRDAEKDKTIDLTGVSYAVFGLGNKTYEHFNLVSRHVDTALSSLGATQVFQRGEGDDDANLEEDFMAWKDQMWSAVSVKYNVQAGGDDANFRQYALVSQPTTDPERIFTGEIATLKSYVTQKRPFNKQNPYLATVIVNRELYRDAERSCRHIELDITNSSVRYAAGDHVAVYARNRESLVQRLAKRLNIDLDAVFSLNAVDESAKKRSPFPCPCSFGTALRHYVDLNGKPSHFVLREILGFTTDPAQKEFLQRVIASHDEFTKWLVDAHRNIVDVLEDLPSANPPVDYLLELLPPLQPRYYSISSSPKAYQNSIHVTAAIVHEPVKSGRTFDGVCTSYLHELEPGARVPIFVRQSNFRLPQDTRVPIIMIGPGTGLAPFRGFIQERSHFKSSGKNLGDTMLFFGCQKRSMHFMYEDELTAAHTGGVLSHLGVACSRDQAQKVYVQHHLQEQGAVIAPLLAKGAFIYICGDARHMAHDVKRALEQIYSQHLNRTAEEAAEYFRQMRAKRRFQEDVWS